MASCYVTLILKTLAQGKARLSEGTYGIVAPHPPEYLPFFTVLLIKKDMTHEQNIGFSYRKKFRRSDWRRAPSKLGFSGFLVCAAHKPV
jgi:hypothetical protein